jgi:hypothetical protein
MRLSLWSINALKRVIADLSTYQDERGIPCEDLDAFVMTLELVYRELLALDCIHGFSPDESAGCEPVLRAEEIAGRSIVEYW